MELHGYQVNACIHEGLTTQIFRGVRSADGLRVIIKVHRPGFNRPNDVARFYNHFNVTRCIASERIDRPFVIEEHGDVLALISEDRGEISLREELRQSPPVPARVLTIGISLARTLEDLYVANVIHKDIKPDNILVDPASGAVRLGDFAIATLLPREAREAQRDTGLSGTLAYISPEQSGRLHRWIDHRSDLYSLGVTLFELATGTLPFTSTDPMELIHAHLTKTPPYVSVLNPAIPGPICDIIMKLLAKAPAERYQSPTGLRIDLEACLHQMRAQGSIAPFPLGQHDALERFVVPDELYGRTSEVRQLLSMFESVVQGTPGLLFVVGSSGIGKSALIRAVQEPILRRRGYFAAGKFDQYNRDIPFSSLVQAFRDLLRQILAEEREQFGAYQSRLAKALGHEGRVIAEVIPEVELFIGMQPVVPELPPADNRERFIRVFMQFLRVFAETDHPLVLFLDDLQWADPATLELLVAMYESEARQTFLFMGAYRDNEVDFAHPLVRAIERISRTGIKMERIALAPLALGDVAALIRGALRSSSAETDALAQIVYEHTGGNPFFCNRYLQSLHDDGHLQFHRDSGRFECDIESLRAARGGADVVEFMVGRLERFPQETQEILKLAAAVGSRFSLEVLAVVRGVAHARAAEALWPALVEGLVLPLDAAYRVFQGPSRAVESAHAVSSTGSYRFLHDRVQQAAYMLIAPEARALTHLTIGRHLLSSTPVEWLDDILFEVTGHFERARTLLTDPEEKVALAAIYLRAGERARSSTAYAAAGRYFSSGLELLGDDGFSKQYDLTMKLYKNCAEATYLEGYFERSEALVRRAISEARTATDKADAYMILIVQYTLRAKYPEAIEAGREALALVGIDLPRDEYFAARDREIAEVEARMAGRTIASLFDLPRMTAPEKLVAMRLLTTMGPPCYRSHQALWAVLCSTAVNLTLQYGNAPQVAYSHTSYGGLLGWVKNEYAQGEQFGALATRLSDSFGSSTDRTVAALMVGSSLRHWSAPLSRSSRDYHDAYTIGLESGNLQYAAYAFGHNMYCRFWQGTPLEQLLSEIAGYLAFSESRKNRWAIDLLDGGRLVASTLVGTAKGRPLFCLPHLDEATYLQRCRGNANTQVLCIYAIMKSEALYLLGEFDAALTASREAQAHLHEVGTQGLLPWARHVFISSMIAARLARDATHAETREPLRQEVERGAKQVHIWAERNPGVFMHQYRLLAAELACLEGKLLEAIEIGDSALDAAREVGCLQDVGIAAENLAAYWRARGRATIERHYLGDAILAFRQWGAVAKEVELQRKFPEAFESSLYKSATSLRVDQTISTAVPLEEALDLGTVLAATHAIFGDMELGRLLETFVDMAMKNAGASRGILLLHRQGEFTIAHDGTPPEVRENSTAKEVWGGKHLSEGVVREVIATESALVLDDNLGRFGSDPYLARFRPPSVACLPMMNRNRLIAILYLENHLVSSCFTPNRLALLQVLGTQAAIAIANAMLYREVQEAEAEARKAREHLTTEVEIRTQDLREANDELTRRADELRLAGERLEQELLQREKAEIERANLQNEVIDNQRARLLEMSTPIIPISEQIVVMPLIGVMDEVRAEQVKMTALEGVSTRGAKTLILDLTGMRQVDSGVAHTVMETANAVRLLGCAMILTGVRAEMARSITDLGLDFSGFITCSTLQIGIQRALGGSERTLVRKNEARR